MFERLLVAIDDSEQTEVTLSFAGSVARQHGSTVRICFVNAFQAGSRGISFHTDEEATQLVIDAISELRGQGVVASGIIHRTQYRRIANRVASEARAMAADAIIVGSPRNRRPGLRFSSAVADRTARLTPLPVLVAPAPLSLPSAVHFELDEISMADREQARSGEETLLD